MSKKFDESSLFREKILESGISDSELKGLVKEAKADLKKTLGQHGKVDDKGIYTLIAKQLGVVLVTSRTEEPEQKSSFETYLDLRDNSRQTSLYVYQNLRSTIDSLLEQVKKEDEGIYNTLLEADDFLNSIIIPSIFKTDDTWVRPKNLNGLNLEDIGKLMSAPDMFRQFFNMVYLPFLENSTTVSIDTTKGLFSIHQAYENVNKHLRYSDNDNNPYFDKQKFEDYGSKYDWTRTNESSNEFLQCYNGVVNLIDTMRNFNTHNKDMKTRSRFNRAGRRITDPLSGIDSPINFITLANLAVHAIYQYIEILQIFLDSKKISKLTSSSS